MSEPTPDEAFEERLRAAFAAAPQPVAPTSILTTVQLLRTDEGSSTRGAQRRRVAMAGVLGLAAVVIAITGVSLLSGATPTILPSSPPVSGGPSSTPGPSAVATSNSVTFEPWAGNFVPSALAAIDATHLVLVGATEDGVGEGVVATSADGGLGWWVGRLEAPPLDGVAAAGTTMLATATCPLAAVSACKGELLVNSEGDISWQVSPTTALRHPTLLDPLHGWAVSPNGRPTTVSATTDGGTTWTRMQAPCRQTAPIPMSIQFASVERGWAACVGDSSTGSQAKEVLNTSDGGKTWSVASAASQDGATGAVGALPLGGQFGGLSMRTDGQGWLWTDRGLYATADAGRTWTIAGWANSDGTTIVESAALVADDAGYALVRDSSLGRARIVRTPDGGRTWIDLQGWPLNVTPAPSATPAPEVIRFAGFATPSVGWALTDRGLRLTNDGGRTWLGAGPPVDYAHWAPKGVIFFDLLHGWVVSEDTFTSELTLWRTDHGGDAWSRTTLPPVAIPAETMGYATIVSIDAVHAVIDVRGGMPNGYQDGVLVTADGGATWSLPKMQSATLGADGLTGDPTFLDPKVGWLAGGAPGTRLWATRDGGDSWTLQRLTPPAGYREDEGMYLAGPRFFSGREGVVARSFFNSVSSILVIYRTVDGGKTWQPINGSIPPASSLSVISATDWILWGGSNGTFWRSTDQGKNWSPAGAAAGLPGGESPVMTDPDHGYVLSQDAAGGALYVTSNGGSTWTMVNVEPNNVEPTP